MPEPNDDDPDYGAIFEEDPTRMLGVLSPRRSAGGP
jgi:hypothetical protein